jgi:uncharacterized RDD family membrane protein YckC
MYSNDVEYAGFWVRLGAVVVDTVLIMVITAPVLYLVYGSVYGDMNNPELFRGFGEVVISWIAPAVATVLFWIFRQATPGKMLFALKVVDAETGAALKPGQAIGRYFAYYISYLPLGLGVLWIVFDSKKRAWHDKLANTVVIRDERL